MAAPVTTQKAGGKQRDAKLIRTDEFRKKTQQATVLHDPRLLSLDSKTCFFTPGIAREPHSASLCPGDSGGPVLRVVNGRPSVVGVNSAFRAGDYNLHTRIDGESPESIGAWIQGRIGK